MARDFTPRDYQSLIVSHILLHPRCAVWAGMGMGKTVSTLTAIAAMQAFEGAGPALVIAPLRVAKTSWPDEVAKWKHLSHLRVSVIAGTAAQRAAALAQKADIYTTNYENIPWLTKALLGTWPFDIVVADEATRLKGFRTHSGGARAKALEKASRSCSRFIELTGTPAPNGLEDLWGQLYFLDRGKRLGSSMRSFHERWFRPQRVGSDAFAVRWDPLAGSDKDIESRVRDLVIKLNAEDWFDISKPLVSDVVVKLDDRAREKYRDMWNDFLLELDGEEIEAANAAAKTSKCLQVASGAVYNEGAKWSQVHTKKIEALKSIVSESGGMPILVAYQFRHEAERILMAFPGARLLDKNPETIREWNAGRIPMLVAHPASCGHGLSLQDGGNILVFFSTGWNLEEHDQMVERIGPTRQKQAGHSRPVFIYNIIAEHTLDETVQKRIVTKREVLDLLLERKHETL